MDDGLETKGEGDGCEIEDDVLEARRSYKQALVCSYPLGIDFCYIALLVATSCERRGRADLEPYFLDTALSSVGYEPAHTTV